MAARVRQAAGPGSRSGSRPRLQRRAARGGPVATHSPVARVAVDVPLAHLDRPFDYLVPERLSAAAVPGSRVRVRFAGQLTGGYLLERVASSEHRGPLARLERVVSPEPVLSPGLAALAREVADRYAGTLADVLRLAIPPRHAGAEAGPPPASEWRQPPCPEPGSWDRYTAGEAFLAALAGGRSPRAVWSALPGPGWAGEIALAAAATAASGRGTVIVVPDARDLSLIDQALQRVLGPGGHVSLAAGLGPAERYRRWLAVSRGAVRVAAGTRAAMFAPVRDLGLVVIWDDGDDLHAEPRAPYPHAREVLALRAHRAKAGALIGGFARTAEAASLIASGWAAALTASRAAMRQHAPLIRAAGDDAELGRDGAARSARLPSLALRTAREGLDRGPVLVQVPRRGYVSAVACQGCRARARCPACGGPLAVEAGGAAARCRWCGRPDPDWQCPACGTRRMRAVVTGSRRTAEELRHAFPGTPVVTSGGTATLAAVPQKRALVVATPGAEPRAAGGYAAALLLDAWVLLSRPSLDAAQEAVRRWLNAAALVVPGEAGGRVVVVGDAALPAVQTVVRWDPVTHADRELAERGAAGFPPAVRMAAVTGPAEAVGQLLAAAPLPPSADVLGPIELPAGPAGAPAPVRTLVRVPKPDAQALTAALQAAQAGRSARKAPGQTRVQVDPAGLI